jgi:hypothetical protein
MDLSKIRPSNSSNPSLSSTGRRSSIDSTTSNTASTRNKLSRLLPGRRSSKNRRSTAQVDPTSDIGKNENLPIDPKDLNLVDNVDDPLIAVEDEDRYVDFLL